MHTHPSYRNLRTDVSVFLIAKFIIAVPSHQVLYWRLMNSFDPFIHCSAFCVQVIILPKATKSIQPNRNVNPHPPPAKKINKETTISCFLKVHTRSPGHLNCIRPYIKFHWLPSFVGHALPFYYLQSTHNYLCISTLVFLAASTTHMAEIVPWHLHLICSFCNPCIPDTSIWLLRKRSGDK